MKIELVTGATTFEAGVNTIKQIDASKPHNLVVVPDAFSMQAEKLIFDCLEISSTFNIEVVGISKLVGKILRDNGITFCRATPLEELFCIYKSFKACEGQLQFFSNCTVELCQKILQVIKQFKACNFTPDKYVEGLDENLNNKMHDLCLIFDAYEAQMVGKMDLSALLGFFIENAEKTLNLADYNLFFVNFDSFTQEINSFICQLAKHVGRVCIGMARPISPKNAYIYENDIFKKTTALAEQTGVLVETKTFPTNLKDEALDIAQNLFAFDIEKKKSNRFLNVLAKNVLDEVEYVAKYIRFEVAGGKHFKNFAVAVPDAKYFPIIKDEFEKYKISFNCDDAVCLSQTILGRFLLKVLDVAKLGFSVADFKFFASSPLFDFDANLFSNLDAMENEAEFVKFFPQFKGIVECVKRLQKADRMEQFSKILAEVVCLVKERYMAFLEVVEDEKHFKKQSENSQAYELVQGVLDRLSQESCEISLVDFCDIFVFALGCVEVETVPTYIDAVYVADATDSYFEDVDVLFVLGAVAGALPRAQSDIGIITDEDIHNLRFPLEPEVKVLNRRNRLKLFELLQHGKMLIVCTPKIVDGKTTAPAEFVKDLTTLFGNRTVSTTAYEEFDVALFTPEQNLERLLFFIGCEENVLPAYTLLSAKQKLPLAYGSALANVVQSTVPSDIEVETISKGLLENISASELECYFACPKKRYFRHVMKLKEKEDVEPNKRMFGNFVHELLKEFVGNFEKNEDVDKFLDENLLRIAKQNYDEKVLKKGYLLRFLKNESRIILKNVVKEHSLSQFTPVMLEEKIVENWNGVKFVGYVDRVDESGKFFRIIDYKTGKTNNALKDLFYGKKLQLFLYANVIKKRLGLDCAGVYYFDCQTNYQSSARKKSLLYGLTLKDNDVVCMTDVTAQSGEKSSVIGASIKKSAKEGEFAYKGSGFVENFDQHLEYAKQISQNAILEMQQGYVASKPFADECKICPYISICRHTEGARKVLKEADEDEQ